MKKGNMTGVVFSRSGRMAKDGMLTLALWAALTLAGAAGEAQYSVAGTFSGTSFAGASPNDFSEGADGAIYGTTYAGGSSGEGTLFRLEAAGPSVLASFSNAGGTGVGPVGRLCLGSDGAFYGVTGAGGAAGAGTLFKYDSNGISILYSFLSTFGDAAYPLAGLVQGSDGAFCGTTERGGDFDLGSVYRWDSNGVAVLHSFSGTAGDGARPVAPVVQGSDGAFYGTTYEGGAGYGTVFRWSSNGFETLHQFTGVNGDGATPHAGLVEGLDGGYYGVTRIGGSNAMGTIFKLTTNGVSVAHSFAGTNGANPVGALVAGADGALYGTASTGGSAGLGTVFRFEGGTLSTVHDFTGGTDGANPASDLFRASDGSVYGTTARGGSENEGVIFKLAFASGSLPTITCPGDVTLSCSPSTGVETVITAQVSAADGGALVVSWNVDGTVMTVPAQGPPTEVTVSFTNTFLPGTNMVVMTVSNEAGTVSCQTVVTVEQGGGVPILGDVPVGGPFVMNSGAQMVGPIVASAPCGLDEAASVLTGSVDTSTVGSKSVEFVAVDLGGNRASKTGTYWVQYAPKGILFGQPTRQALMPVRADGVTMIQGGRTVPVKFRVADAQGNSIGTPGVVTDFRLVQTSWKGRVTVVNEATASTSHWTAFRWEANSQSWIFNLKSKVFASGTWCLYRIYLNDGTWIDFQVQVR